MRLLRTSFMCVLLAIACDSDEIPDPPISSCEALKRKLATCIGVRPVLVDCSEQKAKDMLDLPCGDLLDNITGE